ncbi:MAG: preprotein translocase subunit SecE [Patescibacteria group bacterium]
MGVIDYIKETRNELKHVSWPTRNQAIIFSVLVIFVSIMTSLFLGFFDFIFSQILAKFVI